MPTSEGMEARRQEALQAWRSPPEAKDTGSTACLLASVFLSFVLETRAIISAEPFRPLLEEPLNALGLSTVPFINLRAVFK